MDIKSLVVLEVKKGEFTFTFNMPVGAKLGDAYEASWECLEKITELIKESVSKAKPGEKQETSGDD
jgi:hypothetical protein